MINIIIPTENSWATWLTAGGTIGATFFAAYSSFQAKKSIQNTKLLNFDAKIKSLNTKLIDLEKEYKQNLIIEVFKGYASDSSKFQKESSLSQEEKNNNREHNKEKYQEEIKQWEEEGKDYSFFLEDPDFYNLRGEIYNKFYKEIGSYFIGGDHKLFKISLKPMEHDIDLALNKDFENYKIDLKLLLSELEVICSNLYQQKSFSIGSHHLEKMSPLKKTLLKLTYQYNVRNNLAYLRNLLLTTIDIFSHYGSIGFIIIYQNPKNYLYIIRFLNNHNLKITPEEVVKTAENLFQKNDDLFNFLFETHVSFFENHLNFIYHLKGIETEDTSFIFPADCSLGKKNVSISGEGFNHLLFLISRFNNHIKRFQTFYDYYCRNYSKKSLFLTKLAMLTAFYQTEFDRLLKKQGEDIEREK